MNKLARSDVSGVITEPVKERGRPLTWKRASLGRKKVFRSHTFQRESARPHDNELPVVNSEGVVPNNSCRYSEICFNCFTYEDFDLCTVI